MLSYTKKNTERRKWSLSLNYEELKQRNAPQKLSQRYDSEDGTSITGDNRRERLLESTDKSEQKSESTVESNLGKSSERRYNQSLFGTDNTSTEKEDDRTRELNSERVEESGNDTNQTGWEDEREYAFGRKRDEQSVGQAEEEMDSDILWNNDRSSSVLSDSFYFVGNLFKMIDNQTRYHRKRIKLSQKEIEKKLAHEQKSDGYEEYEDYYNDQLSM